MGRKPWQRSGPDRRLRGRAGQAQRQRRLDRTNGLCEHCEKEGKTTLASIVNHIVPLARGGPDTDENTENLCVRHDEIVTAQQFNRRDPIEGKGVDRNGRPISRNHPWNRPVRT